MKKKFDYFSDKYQLSHHSNNIIYNYLKWLTKDIDFRNKNVLDVGGGSGLISYFSHVNGANKVVNLEPFASGSREHKNNESDWYKVCDKVKKKRNGQFPNYLAREVLILYQEKFPPKADDQ